MSNNAQSRKWTLVINNPIDYGFDHDTIVETLQRFSPTYFCLSDEIATTGTYHTHIFLYSLSPIRFSTVKSRFSVANIQRAYGSAEQNRLYIQKSGKWANSGKAETSVDGSFLEWGDLPAEKEEKAPQMFRLIQNINDGMSTSEIIKDSPNLAFRVREIDTLRQTLLSERYATQNRPLEVSYIFGESGTGKTSSIYKQHNPLDICRITNYRVGRGISFDGYHGQDILVFEEFSSQIPIEEMLNYLDYYPIFLQADFLIGTQYSLRCISLQIFH